MAATHQHCTFGMVLRVNTTLRLIPPSHRLLTNQGEPLATGVQSHHLGQELFYLSFISLILQKLQNRAWFITPQTLHQVTAVMQSLQ